MGGSLLTTRPSRAAAHLKEAKPKVEDKIILLDKIPALPGVSNLDTTQAKEVFRLWRVCRQREDARGCGG